MRSAAQISLALGGVLAAPLWAQALPVLTHFETLIETQPTGETFVVVRLIAPEIAHAGFDPELAQAAMERACVDLGLPAVAELAQTQAVIADQIIVQLMDRPFARGTHLPDAVQFVAGFTPQEGSCLWEAY